MAMNEKNTLGRRIAHARKSGLNRLTQAQVAKELGVTPQAVSGWERDEALPELDKIERLAALLGTDIIWLMRGLSRNVPLHYMEEAHRNFPTSKQPAQKVPAIDLSLIAHQLDRLISEVSSMRDDVSVLTAIVTRLEDSQSTLLQELRDLTGSN